MKVGDLVRMPEVSPYWWSRKVGLVDLVESKDGYPREYRVLIASAGPHSYVRFNDVSFCELVSEARRPS